MIEVTIGGTTVAAEQAGEGWVNRMIVEARRGGGTMPCVRVTVQASDLQIGLITPGCGGGTGGCAHG
jgi:hypothetical protein